MAPVPATLNGKMAVTRALRVAAICASGDDCISDEYSLCLALCRLACGRWYILRSRIETLVINFQGNRYIVVFDRRWGSSVTKSWFIESCRAAVHLSKLNSANTIRQNGHRRTGFRRNIIKVNRPRSRRNAIQRNCIGRVICESVRRGEAVGLLQCCRQLAVICYCGSSMRTWQTSLRTIYLPEF